MDWKCWKEKGHTIAGVCDAVRPRTAAEQGEEKWFVPVVPQNRIPTAAKKHVKRGELN